MRARWPDGRGLRALVVPLTLAGVLAAVGSSRAPASACGSWTRVEAPSPGGSSRDNFLYGAAAVSARNAWAVGVSFSVTGYQTLVLHWDATGWKRVASPNARDGELYGVAATSPRNAWAVGDSHTGAFVVHWDGSTWRRVASPNPGGSRDASLRGVVVSSPRDAWAVGYYHNRAASADQTLVLHWDGATWRHVASPNPRSSRGAELYGVAATSPRNAWAVGEYYNGLKGAYLTLVLHWDGTGWKRVASPNPRSGENYLNGVAATSPGNAWAVGEYYIRGGTADRTLVLHWDGAAWQRAASPNPGSADNILRAVAATSPRNAWAVGQYNFALTPVLSSPTAPSSCTGTAPRGRARRARTREAPSTTLTSKASLLLRAPAPGRSAIPATAPRTIPSPSIAAVDGSALAVTFAMARGRHAGLLSLAASQHRHAVEPSPAHRKAMRLFTAGNTWPPCRSPSRSRRIALLPGWARPPTGCSPRV